jgi:hypothetical protein
MLNHLITIFNVFGYDASMRMLEFKIKSDSYWSSIRTMLLYLGYVENTWKKDIPLDVALTKRLKEL